MNNATEKHEKHSFSELHSLAAEIADTGQTDIFSEYETHPVHLSNESMYQ